MDRNGPRFRSPRACGLHANASSPPRNTFRTWRSRVPRSKSPPCGRKGHCATFRHNCAGCEAKPLSWERDLVSEINPPMFVTATGGLLTSAAHQRPPLKPKVSIGRKRSVQPYVRSLARMHRSHAYQPNCVSKQRRCMLNPTDCASQPRLRAVEVTFRRDRVRLSSMRPF